MQLKKKKALGKGDTILLQYTMLFPLENGHIPNESNRKPKNLRHKDHQ